MWDPEPKIKKGVRPGPKFGPRIDCSNCLGKANWVGRYLWRDIVAVHIGDQYQNLVGINFATMVVEDFGKRRISFDRSIRLEYISSHAANQTRR